MNPVNWFEIPVLNMDRAKAFYEEVFEIEIGINDLGNILMGWFPFDHSAPGATGSLVKADAYTPSHEGSLVYFSVQEIETTLRRVTGAGGKVLQEKYAIGEHGFCGVFEDTEGNRVALHQGG